MTRVASLPDHEVCAPLVQRDQEARRVIDEGHGLRPSAVEPGPRTPPMKPPVARSRHDRRSAAARRAEADEESPRRGNRRERACVRGEPRHAPREELAEDQPPVRPVGSRVHRIALASGRDAANEQRPDPASAALQGGPPTLSRRGGLQDASPRPAPVGRREDGAFGSGEGPGRAGKTDRVDRLGRAHAAPARAAVARGKQVASPADGPAGACVDEVQRRRRGREFAARPRASSVGRREQVAWS